MSNRELPMMPWFPERFAISVATWAFAERAAYRALLDAQWSLAVLPAETWRLAQAIGMRPDDFEKVWHTVSSKFDKVDGGLQNKNLEIERVKAFQLKNGRQKGALATNAQRYASPALSETPSESLSANGATRSKSLSDHSVSGSSEEKIPSQPFPAETGKGRSRENGTNPRALGTNPRARGRNPRVVRDASLSAWRALLPQIDQVPGTNRTWAYVGEHCRDRTAYQAAEEVGFKRIAERDRYTEKALQTEFREVYERLQRREHHA